MCSLCWVCPEGSQIFMLRSILHSFPICPFIRHQEEPTDFSTLCPHTLLPCDKASAVLDRGGAFAWRPHRGVLFLGPLPVQPPSRTVAVHSLEKMKSQITQQNTEYTSSVPHPQPLWWISVFWLQQCSCNQLPRRHHGERRLN